MNVDPTLKNILPGLIELAMDSQHSLDVVSVQKGENSVKINLAHKNGEKYEIEIEKT